MTWLDPAAIKAWLRLTDTADDELVSMCAAAVEPYVERSRPDMWYPDAPSPTLRRAMAGRTRRAVGDPTYRPDAEVMQAGVMLAARLYRRRNSSGGIESMGDSVLYVARYDPEIERALRTAGWRMPGVG